MLQFSDIDIICNKSTCQSTIYAMQFDYLPKSKCWIILCGYYIRIQKRLKYVDHNAWLQLGQFLAKGQIAK